MASERILLAEDEVLISFALESALEDAGYRVVWAASGDAALLSLEQDPEQFDCLITDIRMPGIDGWAVADRARELRPDLPIIYITGDSQSEWPKRGVPNSSLLAKPFKLDDAAARVAEVLQLTGYSNRKVERIPGQ
jgi:CheY-like chemotaxis protein